MERCVTRGSLGGPLPFHPRGGPHVRGGVRAGTGPRGRRAVPSWVADRTATIISAAVCQGSSAGAVGMSMVGSQLSSYQSRLAQRFADASIDYLP